MPEPSPSTRAAGTLGMGVGLVALVGYGVFGASPQSPDLPSGQLAIAALLVVMGGVLRRGGGPRWGEVGVGLLTGVLAYDLLLRLVG